MTVIATQEDIFKEIAYAIGAFKVGQATFEQTMDRIKTLAEFALKEKVVKT